MEYLVVDLEGTCCDDGSIPPAERETIEIGAVIVTDAGEISGDFSKLVKPVRHPSLTRFCTKLTGIRQHDVDVATPFPSVFGEFLAWAGDRRMFCSWGKYDLDQFRRDCSWNHLPLHFDRHGDLARMFGRKVGHRKAMKLMGIEACGSHHRGLDDAKNIAAILVAMLRDGRVLKTNLL